MKINAVFKECKLVFFSFSEFNVYSIQSTFSINVSFKFDNCKLFCVTVKDEAVKKKL